MAFQGDAPQRQRLNASAPTAGMISLLPLSGFWRLCPEIVRTALALVVLAGLLSGSVGRCVAQTATRVLSYDSLVKYNDGDTDYSAYPLWTEQSFDGRKGSNCSPTRTPRGPSQSPGQFSGLRPPINRPDMRPISGCTSIQPRRTGRFSRSAIASMTAQSST